MVRQWLTDWMIQWFNPLHPLISEPNFSGIQLHSSQNNNVVLFFVVHVSVAYETNLFISKYLIRYPQASTAGIVEIPLTGVIADLPWI